MSTIADTCQSYADLWTGLVDGESKASHAAVTDFLRPNLLVVLEFRPDALDSFARATLAAKRTAGDPTPSRTCFGLATASQKASVKCDAK